ncbi:membrane protein [Prauserella halophila]|uniref:Membrane protein n=1 Tax=Prauserella halophila TaxID=185641 RepID=A0ABN1W652_9PSEU|nr:hypothetical protein [Prauserella halophila]MCP2236068.1 hypothetical protein [Prauserella halophila]
MPLPGPDTRVVELRVPGLIGTTGESLLDSVGTVDVDGDGTGRIVRPSDRLRRPAPGPVLQALGRSMPRTLEGYLWNRMTSGRAANATWALLFPFSLANVAHWMLPPVPEASRASAALNRGCRGLLRVAAVLLTMLLVAQLGVVTLDMFAAQCLTAGSGCLDSAPSWLGDIPGLRTAAGLLPLLGVAAVLFWVSRTSWRPDDQDEPPHDHLGGGLSDVADTAALRCVHVVAALGVTALLLLGGPLTMPAGTVAATLWVVTLVLLGSVLLVSMTPARRVLPAPMRRALFGVAIAVTVAAAMVGAPLPATLPGTNATVELVGAALLGGCALFALLLVPTVLLARREWAHLPRRLRPWAGGWAAAPALALAGLLGGGFGAGLAVALRQLLGSDGLRLPEGYDLITMLWGGGLVVAGLLTAWAVAGSSLRRVRRGVPDIVTLLQGQQAPAADDEEASAAWARAGWDRKYLHRLVLTFACTLGAGAVVLVALRVTMGPVPGWLAPLSAVGVLALGALAAGLLRAVYTAATGQQRSRHLGAFTDLASFWPRAAHPVVPPSYALKVVPELADRVRTHLEEPNTRVVLAGYHVGGLLTVLAAARLADELSDEDRERLGLLTAGAPLQWGYQRAFPAMFPSASLARLSGGLSGRWRGLCRGTDAFGGGATTWRHQVASGMLLGVGYCGNGGIGAVEPAVQGPTGVLVLGGDHWLPDPMREPVSGRRWTPGVRKHADYVGDPEWDRAVVMAAGLEDADLSASLAEQVSLFGDVLGTPRCTT